MAKPAFALVDAVGGGEDGGAAVGTVGDDVPVQLFQVPPETNTILPVERTIALVVVGHDAEVATPLKLTVVARGVATGA